MILTRGEDHDRKREKGDGIKQHRPLDPVTIHTREVLVPPLYLSSDLDAYAIGII